jgi:hypothetical protein
VPEVADLSFLFRIGAGSFICLLPLAIYLFYLARLNYRRRPTLLAGTWDFGCLMLGLSGFLLVGGPLLVSVLDSTWRGLLFTGDFRQIQQAWMLNSVIWSTLAGSYLLFIAGLIGWSMWRRASVSVLYNVAPETLPALLTSAIENRGLRWRQGRGFIEVSRAAPGSGEPTPFSAGATLAVDATPSMAHALLRWSHADPVIRAEVEAALGELVEAVESPDNATAGWLATAGVSLLVVVVGWLGFLAYLTLFRPRG